MTRGRSTDDGADAEGSARRQGCSVVLSEVEEPLLFVLSLSLLVLVLVWAVGGAVLGRDGGASFKGLRRGGSLSPTEALGLIEDEDELLDQAEVVVVLAVWPSSGNSCAPVGTEGPELIIPVRLKRGWKSLGLSFASWSSPSLDCPSADWFASSV